MIQILRTYFTPFIIIHKQRQLLLPLFLLAVLCAPSLVQAEPTGAESEKPPAAQGSDGATTPPDDRFRSRDPLAIYREAGISTQQENLIKDLAKQFEDANAARLQNVITQLQEMKALSLKADPDEDAVIAKQEQISKLQAEMGMERIKLLLKIRHVLTTQQKQKLVELMQKNMASAPAN